MLLLACLFIPMVFAAPDPRTTIATSKLEKTIQPRNINGYNVYIDNHILKSVEKTSNSLNELNLAGLGLVGIDRKAFNDLTDLIYLRLADNSLEKLPQLVFLELVNLEQLSLANNSLFDVKNIFVGLDKLQVLDITNITEKNWNRDMQFGLPNSTYVLNGNTQLTVPATSRKNESEPYTLLCINEDTVEFVTLANDIENLRTNAKPCERAELLDYYSINKYRALTLQDQSISKFANGWYQLQSLAISKLDLSYNDISHITRETLNDLPEGVSRIILRKNKIESLERGIIDNQNVKILDLKFNKIGKIEEYALANTRLVNLYLTGNKLENNTWALTLPSTLIELLIDENNIVKLLPNAFSSLVNLEILSLRGNKLVSLEKNVFNGLGNISQLSVANNELRKISGKSFYGLSNKMKTLLLSGNKLERLEKRTFINAPTVELDLSFNKINMIESEAFYLLNLTTLKLNDNLLTSLKSDTFVGVPRAIVSLEGNRITMVGN